MRLIAAAADSYPSSRVPARSAVTISDISGRRREPITFRQFVALPAARALLHRGRPVQIGGRAFDLLLVLLRARGTLVSKCELIRQVWPDTCVDEVNLRFQMTSLRKLLGSDRDLIKTVNGRGYLLIDDCDDPMGGQLSSLEHVVT